MKLLLVDDDEDTRELLSLYLERKGWVVHAKANLSEARRALAADEYTALLTDLSLPDGDGRDLLISGRPPTLRWAGVLSGRDSAAERARSRSAGFDVHLTKPLDPSFFDRVSAELLQRAP